MIPEPRCPINYFGKGENYALPDNKEACAEYERQWKEWEAEHPEDPTGEATLQAWKDQTGKESQPLRKVKSMSMEFDGPFSSEEICNVRLQLPEQEAKMLKKYASFKRKRPRDIIVALIQTYCKL